MLENDFLSFCKNAKKGTLHSVKYTKPLKLYDKYLKQGMTAYKETIYSNIQIGITYDNSKAIKALREVGAIPETNQGIASTYSNEKTQAVYPFGLWSEKSHNYQMRLYLNRNSKPITRWFLNGVETPYETIEEYLTKADRKKAHKAETLPELWETFTDEIKRLWTEYNEYKSGCLNLGIEKIDILK